MAPGDDREQSALIERLAGVVCDLDGVVYQGPVAVSGAVSALERIQRTTPVLFATNNASRSPVSVGEHLAELGIAATAQQVLTSSTVGASVLATELAPGSPVLAVGGPGVREALTEVGLVPVRASAGRGERVSAVLQGYGPDVSASDLGEAAFAIAGGARWIATNTDATLPTERGIAPGNGTLVAAVRTATGQEPEVVGKPGPLMYQQAARRVGSAAEMMVGVGDRLDTDIAGARVAGMRSALVLTGVHGVTDVVQAAPPLRPDYLLHDLGGLLEPYAAPVQEDTGRVTCGRAWARWSGGALDMDGEGLDLVRAALVVLWRAIDDGGADREALGSSVEVLSRAVSGAHRPGPSRETPS